MVNYYIVTGVYDHTALCVPEEIFKEDFVTEGGECTHKWYQYLYIDCHFDESLQEAWDALVEAHCIDGKESPISFGDVSGDSKFIAIYKWSPVGLACD